MYFNHQLRYSVSSTASSTREIVFFSGFVLFSIHRIFRRQFCWYGKRDRKRKHIKNESCPTTFLRQSRVNFSLEWGQPHTFPFAHRFFLRQSFFFWIFRTSKDVIHQRAYDEYSNRHAPDYIFKNGIATRYGGNIKDLS